MHPNGISGRPSRRRSDATRLSSSQAGSSTLGRVSALILRAVADALEAGMSAREVAGSGVLARHGAAVAGALERGDGWADGLRAAGLVDDAGRAIVGAGERGGFLPAALRAVATDADAALARRRRALATLAYPAFLVGAASLILPLPVAVTGGMGAYLARALPGFVVVTAAMLALFVVIPRLPLATRARLTALAARIPVYGAVIAGEKRAAALEVLGRMLAAGVPVSRALPSALAAAGLEERALAGGDTLAAALARAGVVDGSATARVALAERTGTLDKALPALAGEARDRAARRFVVLSLALGLVCFLAVAATIGSAVISGARGYFDAIDAATAE